MEKPFFKAEKRPPNELIPPPSIISPPIYSWPPPYYVHDGLRRVQPYHFTYNTNCKMRWRDREILDIFADEFRDRPLEYYKTAMEEGYIVLNGKRLSSVHEIVRNGDIISHTAHRHEPPISSQPIGILHEDNDLIVINKPAGMPVHPTGRYHYNSVVEIMRAERGFEWKALPCNRLDRLTSGIMFIGKHKQAAKDMSDQLTARTVRKEYIARVTGRFPDGDVICDQPILQISPKLGLNRVRARGKPARTVFKRLAYYPSQLQDVEPKQIFNGATDDEANKLPKLPWATAKGYSIVRCRPLTGRTHQLRVHLQFLGHPITNDPIYCNQKVFGHSLAQGDANSDNDEDIISCLSRMGKEEVADAVAYHEELMDVYNKRKAEKMTGELCDICQTPLYSDPGIHELGIYLHARRYASADGQWDYETPLPDWALPPPGMEGPREASSDTDPLALELQHLELNDDDQIAADTTKEHEESLKPQAAAA